MSIRFIGSESPKSKPITSSFARNHFLNPWQIQKNEIKHQKMESYKEQLDQQVAEIKKRKLQKKRLQQEEDERRQRKFYQSLKKAQENTPPKYNSTRYKNKEQNFHFINPQTKHTPFTQKVTSKGVLYHDRKQQSSGQYRFANIGRRKLATQPAFEQNQSKYKNLSHQNSEYSPQNIQRRRKIFREQIDRQLRDAYFEISKSKNVDNDDLQRIRRRLKTQNYDHNFQNDDLLQENKFSRISNRSKIGQKEDQFYELPFKKSNHQRYISNY